MKLIKDLKQWEVLKRASEGEPFAYRRRYGLVAGANEWEKPEGTTHTEWNMSEYEFAIIDTTEPELDWSKFNWGFFEQYGGLLVVGDNIKYNWTRWLPAHHSKLDLRESPLYPWTGGECPVPGNVEVEIVLRDVLGESSYINSASSLWWKHKKDIDDIIAFKITGKIK